jgi:hypothetical protein
MASLFIREPYLLLLLSAYIYDADLFCGSSVVCFDWVSKLTYLSFGFIILTLPQTLASIMLPQSAFTRWYAYGRVAVPLILVILFTALSFDFGGGIGGTVAGELALVVASLVLALHYLISIILFTRKH